MSASTHPELSSLATGLDELIKRFTLLAESLDRDKDDRAPELYEVERTLISARRRIEKILKDS